VKIVSAMSCSMQLIWGVDGNIPVRLPIRAFKNAARYPGRFRARPIAFFCYDTARVKIARAATAMGASRTRVPSAKSQISCFVCLSIIA
jgi:hypothetical protein